MNENLYEKIDNSLIIQNYNENYNKWYVALYMYLLDNLNHRGEISINALNIYQLMGYKYDRHYNNKVFEILEALNDFYILDNPTELNLTILKINHNSITDKDWKKFWDEKKIDIKDDILIKVQRESIVKNYFTILEYIDYYKIIDVAQNKGNDFCDTLNVYCYILNHFDRSQDESDQHCYCGLEKFSDDLKMGKEKIIKITNKLEKEKIIRIVKGNRTNSNSYYRG